MPNHNHLLAPVTMVEFPQRMDQPRPPERSGNSWLTYLIKMLVGRLLLESWKGSFCPLVLSSFWKVYLTFLPDNLLCVFEHLALVEVRKSPENCWMTHLHSHGTRLHVAGMVQKWPELIIQLFDWAAHQNGFLSYCKNQIFSSSLGLIKKRNGKMMRNPLEVDLVPPPVPGHNPPWPRGLSTCWARMFLAEERNIKSQGCGSLENTTIICTRV